MIQSWRFDNFKAVRQLAEPLEFRDVTIFAGANSSGKSTVLQSILLFMQTAANREDVPLQLNGELVTLGQVGDVWHRGEIENSEGQVNLLGFEMLLRDAANAENLVFCRLYFTPVDAQGTQVFVSHGDYAIQFNDSRDEISIAWHQERRQYVVIAISESLERRIVAEQRELGLIDIDSLLGTDVRLEDFYPRSIRIRGRKTTRELNWAIALANPIKVSDEVDLTMDIPLEYWSKLSGTVKRLKLPQLEVTRGKKRNQPQNLAYYRTWFNDLTPLQAQNLEKELSQQLEGIVEDVAKMHGGVFFKRLERNLTDLFTRRIRYLSANRISPTMLYSPIADTDWSEVGVTGNNVGNAIHENDEKPIRYFDPYEGKVLDDAVFRNALIRWMQYFQLVDRVEVEDRGKLGMLLKIYAQGVDKELDLTSVGFGTSQVLPILVQGLLTPPGCVFIVEQPEVHLHPGVQAKLADFFLGLTQAGVQCIIETHSEHIINRLRLRIAEDDGAETAKRIQIYFAERDGAESQFRRIEVNEYGAIAKWPAGFFDQGEEDNIRLARIAAQKKRARIQEVKNAASG